MTTNADVVNLALQSFGSRTTVTAGELSGGTSNEGIQANLVMDLLRDELLRKAPWNCSLSFRSLSYITSLPGTPENQSAATSRWQRGQPLPPWLYEYQYPVNCLRALYIVPEFDTGTDAGVLIYPNVNNTPRPYNGPYPHFKVATDEFYSIETATLGAAGSGYAVNDEITLALGAVTSAPIGGAAQFKVETLAGSGVATFSVVNQVLRQDTPRTGSYYSRQTGAISQGSTNGSGSGATFTPLTWSALSSQRVVLTNQRNALLAMIRQVNNANLMDPMFLDAWINVLGARLCVALTGDKQLANLCLAKSNDIIQEARKADGNEGFIVDDRMPDWMTIRGIGSFNQFGQSFEWGPLWPMY